MEVKRSWPEISYMDNELIEGKHTVRSSCNQHGVIKQKAWWISRLQCLLLVELRGISFRNICNKQKPSQSTKIYGTWPNSLWKYVSVSQITDFHHKHSAIPPPTPPPTLNKHTQSVVGYIRQCPPSGRSVAKRIPALNITTGVRITARVPCLSRQIPHHPLVSRSVMTRDCASEGSSLRSTTKAREN